jgi:hypothetical protein
VCTYNTHKHENLRGTTIASIRTHKHMQMHIHSCSQTHTHTHTHTRRTDIVSNRIQICTHTHRFHQSSVHIGILRKFSHVSIEDNFLAFRVPHLHTPGKRRRTRDIDQSHVSSFFFLALSLLSLSGFIRSFYTHIAVEVADLTAKLLDNTCVARTENFGTRDLIREEPRLFCHHVLLRAFIPLPCVGGKRGCVCLCL